MFWVFFIFCVFQRLFELFLSKIHQSKLAVVGFENREAPWSLRLMIFLHVGWFVVMLGEAYLAPSKISSEFLWLAIFVFIVAQALRLWAISTLGDHWNISVWSPKELAIGKPLEFVAEGPYRFIRHPNYLAVILEFASLPIIGGAVLTATVFSLFNALVLKSRISVEEKFLFSRPGYQEVMGPKARFIPGLV
jgi:methyltransferase